MKELICNQRVSRFILSPDKNIGRNYRYYESYMLNATENTTKTTESNRESRDKQSRVILGATGSDIWRVLPAERYPCDVSGIHFGPGTWNSMT